MRILILVHPDLVPPKDVNVHKVDWVKVPWVAEYDVWAALTTLGHEVQLLGVAFKLSRIREAVAEFKPHVVFNLLEEFQGEAIFDSNIVAYLELLGVPYTGCNPKGLILARDKALSKKILSYHRIGTPKFQVFPRNQPKMKIKIKSFPLIVKCLSEESSTGISQASVVNNEGKLRERVHYIHTKFNSDSIVEEFIEGREFYIGVLGNYRATVLPPFELKFKKVKESKREFYTTRAKYNEKYRKLKGINTSVAKLEKFELDKLKQTAKCAYRALGLNGYARMDVRVSPNGKIYVLEANPNPDISEYEDFSDSATQSGLEYPKLLEKIISLGRQWSSV